MRASLDIQLGGDSARHHVVLPSSGDPLVDRVVASHLVQTEAALFDPRFLCTVQKRLVSLRPMKSDAPPNRDGKKGYLVRPAQPHPKTEKEEEAFEEYSYRRMSAAAKLGKVALLAARMKPRHRFGLPATVCLFVKQLLVRSRQFQAQRLEARRQSVARSLARKSEPQSLSGRIKAACGKELAAGALGKVGMDALMQGRIKAACSKELAGGALGKERVDHTVMQGGVAFATRSKRLDPARALESQLHELEQDLSARFNGV